MWGATVGKRIAHRAHVGLFAGPDLLGVNTLIEQHPSAGDRAETPLLRDPDKLGLSAGPVERVADRRVRSRAIGRQYLPLGFIAGEKGLRSPSP
jgi:hypothetical protein